MKATEQLLSDLLSNITTMQTCANRLSHEANKVFRTKKERTWLGGFPDVDYLRRELVSSQLCAAKALSRMEEFTTHSNRRRKK